MTSSPLNRSNLRSPLDKKPDSKIRSVKIRFIEEETQHSPIACAKTDKSAPAESTAPKDHKDHFVIQSSKQKNRKTKKDAMIAASLTIEEEHPPAEVKTNLKR
uniref:Uncharacterized protein n=1 Tax=Guillardia theta TaxID=55529 RepID=A0A7S4PF01_GUITH|mmetsp:Transcript_49626/g.155377  ORF Transcript_49626/g.155377 Transcript_49626/m.155377 type:complete len:103 (+) Transcript_49626:346-654(+)